MKKVVLDPGHGGNDSGATNGSYQEKDFTLQISLAIRDYLKSQYQADIYMTRTTDQTVSLKERTDYANRLKADFFCSIHVNAGKGTGWEGYIFNGRVPSSTIRYRDMIHHTVIEAIGQKYSVNDRGEKRANFHVLRETQMSSILLENLFIDHSTDIRLLTNRMFIQDLSHAIAIGIAKALHLPSV
ncbi:N-acetylmuramoyl-L-alanine amidase [Seinonella peptonophila]|uniref:N-acetylmuramoyl-L-alanine amidase n=1 Tax=Seinonella peptonophila TaxID=112248 RepID=A0A1M4SUA2_9BACL|nr:N-acetylmuramoyl-L-alanine amidase [Seinonella peptonophila]SHE35775.1 N-acetylmuramoyl-L-alanine amidase [Seinonella peptonophila]